MTSKVRPQTLVDQIKKQVVYLRDPEYAYHSLQVYVAGVPEPWEFNAEDEFEFHEEAGLLIVRDGPIADDGHGNASVPEYVFRLEHVVATQLA